ncbi:MAG: hypothetical protein EOM26_05515 [Alphaproteobacteria bacterium]|nr:hypothetical protein [Alphaproteobacteria bacterium]
MQVQTKEMHAEELENIMLCARWLVHQFENINCHSLAVIFQKAINDAEAWIQTMVRHGTIPPEFSEPIKAREAELIHGILVKYASIDDPEMRREALDKMLEATRRKIN